MKKLFGYLLATLAVATVGVYFSFFYHPQTQEQAQMNEAWVAFADEIASLGELVQNAPFNNDQQTSAEGYRHMARYLSTMIAKFTDHNNPDYPLFVRFPNSVARIGWDNPDNPYLSSVLRGDHSYRIRGNIKNFDLVTFNVYSGMLGYTAMADMRTISGITSDELAVEDDGSFELILSEQPQPGNWLKLESDADNVVIRRLVSNWQESDEGDWEIVNLNTLGTSPSRPTPDEVVAQLQESLKMVRGVREILTVAHRILFQLKFSPNEVPVPQLGDPSLPMSDPAQATSRAYFKLAGGEALLITVPEMDCRFANIQLANPWMESLDYANRQSSLNNHSRKVDADGKIRYVISATDPGVPNWLDTAGYSEGSLFARWTYCKQYPTELDARLVKLSTLRAVLPVSTPLVSTTEREQVIEMRQSAISRRYAGG